MALEEPVDRTEQEWGKENPFVVSVRRCLAILAETEARGSDRLHDQERQYALLRSRIDDTTAGSKSQRRGAEKRTRALRI